MDLALEVNGESVEIDPTPQDVGEMLRVIKLCGVEAFQRLAEGEWDEMAARAMLYVRLDVETPFEDFLVTWPEGLTQPDKATEADIPMEVSS